MLDKYTSPTYPFIMKDFEWDEQKRNSNIEKHGLDFIDAIKVFEDNYRIEYENVRNGEKRYQTIGTVNEVTILVVYTSRSTKKRIISARRASRNERKLYYNFKGVT